MNIGHITIYMYDLMIIIYHMHARSISYIEYDLGVSNKIITQKI
jgi:hypothetical protein